MGWVSFVRGDPDDTDDGSWISAYCPPCAVARFDYGHDTAENTSASGIRPPTDVMGRSQRRGEGTLRAAVRRPGEVEGTTLVTGIAGRAERVLERDVMRHLG